MAFLLPFSLANLRASYTDKLLGSDASLQAAGGVACKVGVGSVEDLWRRIPLKLRGQRLLDHISAHLKSSGLDVGVIPMSVRRSLAMLMVKRMLLRGQPRYRRLLLLLFCFCKSGD